MTGDPKKKKRILSAAKEIFLKKGYTEAKMSEIAARANVSLGTIYNFFEGKRDLFDRLNLPELESIRPEREKKKREILRAALVLFGENGYAGTTMEQIAQSVGFSKAALYQYFRSKEELFSEMLRTSRLNVTAKDIKGRTGGKDWEEVIIDIARSYLETHHEPERTAFLRSVIQDSNKFPDIGCLYYKRGFSQAAADIAFFLKKVQKKGKIKNVNLKLAATILLGALLSYVILYRVIKGIEAEFSEEEMVSLCAEIFINGLKASPAKKSELENKE